MYRIVTFILFLISFYGCTTKPFLINEHYLKKEYNIKMRDGVKLFTAVYQPKDTTQNYPILINRTPYSVAPYGEFNIPNELGPSDLFVKSGYIFVYQDVRGRFMSEGDFVNMRPYIEHKTDSLQIDENSDTYDTIEWLLKNIPNNNGRVGIWGISYPGFYAAMAMLNAHPALKAVSPQAAIADWFIGDDMHHHGAFSLNLAFNFFYSFGQPRNNLTMRWPPRFDHGTKDGYQFFLDLGPLKNANEKYFKHSIPFWNALMDNGMYNRFWQNRNLLPHIKNVQPAVLLVGGWFDAEDLYGPLNIYQKLVMNNSKGNIHFVMGPWRHGGWNRTDGASLGDISFHQETSKYYQQDIEYPFFNYYLKDGPKYQLDRMTCFDTGTKQWHNFSAWPLKEAKEDTIFLSDSGKLSFNEESSQIAFDSFLSDPSNPVPYINKISTTWEATYMIADQRFASLRNDVLTYQTLPLEESVTLAGPITADLYISTTGTDCDWVVKVIDVYPEETQEISVEDGYTLAGYQQMVRMEILRSKFRNSYEKPDPLIPNKIEQIHIPLNDVMHTFKKGHRIMIQIQSSLFPLFDRNPQFFCNIYKADEKDFQESEQRVYHSVTYPSQIRFSVYQP